MSYATDRQESDLYIPEIKRIVGPYLLVPSPLEVDQKQAADLVVLTGRDVTIACRTRRPGFLERYRNEFTIRSARDSGAKTELAKIIDGWGDWFFYGHQAHGRQRSFAQWFLIDLSAFRAHLIKDGYRENRAIRTGKVPNGDGTYFRWFDVTSFPADPPLLIASDTAGWVEAA